MPRGRPRQFDEDAAINAAMQVFWQKGLAATSLDDLADAMQMNRPSIYNAFGGKEDLYRTSLARFCGQLDQGLASTMADDIDLRTGLLGFYEQAIEVYCGHHPAMGCLMICTAPAAALQNPEVGKDLRQLIQRLDQALAARLALAQQQGQLDPHLDVAQTAKLLQATLQTIALRARAGERKSSLRKLAAHAVASLI